MDTSDAIKLNATIAAEAYRPPGERRDHIGEWRLDKALGDDENVVYYNPTVDRAIHGMRGSHTLSDWLWSDVQLARGRFRNTPRHTRNVMSLDKTKRKYKNLSATGHSLGGASVVHAGDVVGVSGHTFNLGQPFTKEDARMLGKCARNPGLAACSITHHKRKGYLVSGIPSLTGTTVRHDGPWWNPGKAHSMEGFDQY